MKTEHNSQNQFISNPWCIEAQKNALSRCSCFHTICEYPKDREKCIDGKKILNNSWNPSSLVRFCMLQKTKRKSLTESQPKSKRHHFWKIPNRKTLSMWKKKQDKSWKWSSGKSEEHMSKNKVHNRSWKWKILHRILDKILDFAFQTSKANDKCHPRQKKMHFISIRFVLCHQIELMFCWNLNWIII